MKLYVLYSVVRSRAILEEVLTDVTLYLTPRSHKLLFAQHRVGTAHSNRRKTSESLFS
jgi:hypothetical protein